MVTILADCLFNFYISGGKYKSQKSVYCKHNLLVTRTWGTESVPRVGFCCQCSNGQY